MLISTGSKPLGRKLDDSQGIILEVVLMAFKESYKPTELAYTLCQVPTSFCFHGKPKQRLSLLDLLRPAHCARSPVRPERRNAPLSTLLCTRCVATLNAFENVYAISATYLWLYSYL